MLQGKKNDNFAKGSCPSFITDIVLDSTVLVTDLRYILDDFVTD